MAACCVVVLSRCGRGALAAGPRCCELLVPYQHSTGETTDPGCCCCCSSSRRPAGARDRVGRRRNETAAAIPQDLVCPPGDARWQRPCCQPPSTSGTLTSQDQIRGSTQIFQGDGHLSRRCFIFHRVARPSTRSAHLLIDWRQELLLACQPPQQQARPLCSWLQHAGLLDRQHTASVKVGCAAAEQHRALGTQHRAERAHFAAAVGAASALVMAIVITRCRLLLRTTTAWSSPCHHQQSWPHQQLCIQRVLRQYCFRPQHHRLIHPKLPGEIRGCLWHCTCRHAQQRVAAQLQQRPICLATTSAGAATSACWTAGDAAVPLVDRAGPTARLERTDGWLQGLMMAGAEQARLKKRAQLQQPRDSSEGKGGGAANCTWQLKRQLERGWG